MIIIVRSDNPQFSHLIGKNPSSPPKLMQERKGVSCGWYYDDNTYCVRFIDDDDEVSYPEYEGQDFEFLSRGKYCSPFLAYKLFAEFMKLDEKYDGEYNNTLEIYSLNTKDSSLELFKKHMPEFLIEETPCEHWEKFKSVTVKRNCTFTEFSNFIKIFLFYLSLDNEQIYHSDELVENQFERLADLDAPYFIRYLYKQNYCKNSEKRFNKVKDLLNQSNKHNYDFIPWNNFEARFKYVQTLIKDSNVYDIGCNSGRYIKMLAGQNISYTGIDIDAEALAKAKLKAERNKIECDFYSSVDDILDDETENKTLLLTEVLEHIYLTEIVDFIKKLCQIPNVKSVVFTTPNIKFNHNYKLYDELRDPDHKWEGDRGLIDFIAQEFIKRKDVTCYMVSPIGDVVDEVCPTFGCIIKFKE